MRMSQIRERLHRLKGERKIEERETIPQVDEKSSTFSGPSAEEWTGSKNVRVQVVENEFGSFLRLRRLLPFHTLHGRYQLGELTRVFDALSLLSPEIGKLEEWLFFDTETTGLSAGVGNFPFLVGTAYFNPHEVVLEQYFLRDPSEEAAMLYEMEHLIESHPHLISYNGKSFDWPLLKNRWILYRFHPTIEPKSHIDLLYPARSLWRGLLSSCRLGEVEAERLGVKRMEDIPGLYVPIYYMQFLAEGNLHLLKGVFRHNEWDLLTLISFSIHLAKLLRDEENFFHWEEEELFRLGNWFEGLKLHRLADRAFDTLLQRPENRKRSYLHEIALVYKKRGDLETAVSIWEELIRLQGKASFVHQGPYVELAKFYEHRRKDYDTALAFAEEAFSLLLSRRSFLKAGKQDEGELEEMKRRMKRLKEKLRRM